jgi:hypothetical protein
VAAINCSTPCSAISSALYRYDIERLGTEYGIKVWGGELVEQELNADVTTALVDQALGERGVYAMIARLEAW